MGNYLKIFTCCLFVSIFALSSKSSYLFDKNIAIIDLNTANRELNQFLQEGDGYIAKFHNGYYKATGLVAYIFKNNKLLPKSLEEINFSDYKFYYKEPGIGGGSQNAGTVFIQKKQNLDPILVLKDTGPNLQGTVRFAYEENYISEVNSGIATRNREIDDEIAALQKIQKSPLFELPNKIDNKWLPKLVPIISIYSYKWNEFPGFAPVKHHLIVAPMAKGISLGSKDVTSDMFYAYGEAIGSLHRLFLNSSKPFTSNSDIDKLRSYTHGDLSPSNVFYDIKTNTISLIDNAGFAKSLDDKQPIVNELFYALEKLSNGSLYYKDNRFTNAENKDTSRESFFRAYVNSLFETKLERAFFESAFLRWCVQDQNGKLRMNK